MGDIYGIGSSALLAYSNALNTVSQNVANANTPGYSRQRVDLQSRPGQIINGNVVDDAGFSRADTLNTYAAQVDGLLSSQSSGLGGPLQSFFTAVNGVSSNPTSSAARQTLLGAAQTLTGQFSSLQDQLNGYGTQVDGQITTQVQLLNGYASQLATLNNKIAASLQNAPTQTPNDLLDQRDQVLRNLAGITSVTSTTADDGTINVYIGSGQALVLGGRSNTVSVGPDSYGRPRALSLNSGGAPIDLTQQLSGGALGGLVDFRNQVLDPATAQLGRIAVALASAMNTQNAQGTDQYGQLGGAFFNAPSPVVTGSLSNTGTATIGVAVTSTTALQATRYEMSYNGTAWSMTDASTGAAVALSGAGTAASPFVAAGVSFVVSGTANAGDKFLIDPVSKAAGSISVAITDPARIAAAAPVQTSAATSNLGSAKISNATVLDVTNPNLLSSVSIQFTSATTYSINGTGSYTYTDGGNIDINGWRVKISGPPQTGDSFTIKATQANSSDNANAKLLAGISSQSLLNGGVDTLSSSNASLVGQVGAQAQQAQTQVDTETAIRGQDQSQRDSLSGVNLDEEAVDLQRYQQGYQAAAQVISTANSLFQSLLNAIQ